MAPNLKPEPLPTVVFLPDIAVTLDDQRREEATAQDPVVVAAEDPKGDTDVLLESMRQIAVECAAIKFARIQAENREAVGSLCSRRVSGLAQIAALEVERHRHQPRDPDVRGARFQRVVQFFLDVLKEAAEETLGHDAEPFLIAYRARVRGWEERIDPVPRGRPE
jgi:hypothetical protein